MVTAWRITKARFLATAFDGEGARRAGGRWNSPGVPAVYTSQSAALATLEMLVHVGRGATLPSYILIPCSFPEALVTAIDRTKFPRDWRSYPAPPRLQALGDAWIASRSSAILQVPSAIIDTESNYLLNPLHPDFASITIGKPQAFKFDLRLVGGL